MRPPFSRTRVLMVVSSASVRALTRVPRACKLVRRTVIPAGFYSVRPREAGCGYPRGMVTPTVTGGMKAGGFPPLPQG